MSLRSKNTSRLNQTATPARVFDKGRHVPHAATGEIKLLGAVLEHIKTEQDKIAPKKRGAGKQHARYKPNGHSIDARNSLAARKRKASQCRDM